MLLRVVYHYHIPRLAYLLTLLELPVFFFDALMFSFDLSLLHHSVSGLSGSLRLSTKYTISSPGTPLSCLQHARKIIKHYGNLDSCDTEVHTIAGLAAECYPSGVPFSCISPSTVYTALEYLKLTDICTVAD
jgi:hypothetical protein